jgi:hypothetical protein
MVAQIFGMTFIGIIVVCLIWTICSFIVSDDAMDRNKELLENMKNFDKNKK